MKTKLFIFLLFINGYIGFSQSLEKLKTATNKLYEANYLMNFDEIVAHTYPKVVESIGKEALLEKLDLDYQNEIFRMRLQLVKPIFLYSEMQTNEGKTFCVVTFKNPVRYFYEDRLNSETASQKAIALKESNNAKEALFEPARNSINVKRNSKYIAVWDETTANQWKFFNLDDSLQRKILHTAFSETAKKELGL